MKTRGFILDAESMGRLATLIGGTWRGFSGRSMGADQLQPFAVLLATADSQVTVNSVVEFFDIMGEQYETAIAELDVDAGGVELKSVASDGRIFDHNAGQDVVDVRVIRDTLDEIRDGEHTWRIVKDTGVLVTLERGSITVTQDDWHDEMLVVSVGDILSKLVVPPVDDRWEDKPGIEYVRNRTLVPVSD